MPHSGQELDRKQTTGKSPLRSVITEAGTIVALALSVLALGVSAYQTRLMAHQTELMQQQARASVWPSLSIGHNLYDQGKEAGFSIDIYNNGVGPAKVESVKATLDGKPFLRWPDLFAALGVDYDHTSHLESSLNGVIQPPANNRETTIVPLFVPDVPVAKKLEAAIPRMGMAICYCSVYDDCWITHWHARGSTPVASCDASGNDEFQQ